MSSASAADATKEIRTERIGTLFTYLEQEGLSQREIALRTNVPAQYVSDVKIGNRNVTELFARRLGEVFGVDYVWLLGGPGTLDVPRQANRHASTQASCWLNVFPHPIEGDPHAQSKWDGSSTELAGAAAGKVMLARQPYVLRFGVDDQKNVLRKNDLLLISQEPNPRAEIHVLRCQKKRFLARETNTGWKPVSKQSVAIDEPTIIGYCVGIIWRQL